MDHEDRARDIGSASHRLPDLRHR